MPVRWILYPKSARPVDALMRLITCFEENHDLIDSHLHDLHSNSVLALLAPSLVAAGYRVERGKSSENKVAVPVLFGLNGVTEKSFFADGFHADSGVVLEVEAGRAVVNNQFLKDLFQACAMQDAQHLAICVRNQYRGVDDFAKVNAFFETLYVSNRIRLPLNSILILGY